MAKNDYPHYINRELKKLEETLSPIMKKTAKYTFWSLPLLSISLINLAFLLVVIPENPSIASVIMYALIGAVGMAFSKEAKLQQKEIQKVSTNYIIERIKQSQMDSTHIKTEYTTLIKENPINSMTYFIEFLQKEKRENYHA